LLYLFYNRIKFCFIRLNISLSHLHCSGDWKTLYNIEQKSATVQPVRSKLPIFLNFLLLFQVVLLLFYIMFYFKHVICVSKDEPFTCLVSTVSWNYFPEYIWYWTNTLEECLEQLLNIRFSKNGVSKLVSGSFWDKS
jgi:hypothetical protein